MGAAPRGRALVSGVEARRGCWIAKEGARVGVCSAWVDYASLVNWCCCLLLPLGSLRLSRSLLHFLGLSVWLVCAQSLRFPSAPLRVLGAPASRRVCSFPTTTTSTLDLSPDRRRDRRITQHASALPPLLHAKGSIHLQTCLVLFPP